MSEPSVLADSVSGRKASRRASRFTMRFTKEVAGWKIVWRGLRRQVEWYER